MVRSFMHLTNCMPSIAQSIVHPKKYFVNFSALAYHIKPSNQEETIVIEDQEAIRHHRAFNDIVAKKMAVKSLMILMKKSVNGNQQTMNLVSRLHLLRLIWGICVLIYTVKPLVKKMKLGVKGRFWANQAQNFFGKPMTLFDVVILREPDADPFVVRIAAVSTEQTDAIQVHDYIQANIWLQAAIYEANQNRIKSSHSLKITHSNTYIA